MPRSRFFKNSFEFLSMMWQRSGIFFLYPLLAVPALVSCSSPLVGADQQLIVFHAGSLSAAFLEIGRAFEAEHPGVRVLREAAGSRTSARKITDLGRQCDILVSADYAVIQELLIPEHATWLLKFAQNEMCVAFHANSKYAGEIDETNWFDILLRDDVWVGRCDPNSAPCGYRALQMAQLAEEFYGIEGIAGRLAEKDRRFLRPKEPDLIALLETETIDYALLYRSTAEKQGYGFVRLPVEINLSDPALDSHYGRATVMVSGATPDTLMEERGRASVYGLTIPLAAPEPELAEDFVLFLLEATRGLATLERYHFVTNVPATSESYARIPAALKPYARPEPTEGPA